jgi:hypothetical protein
MGMGWGNGPGLPGKGKGTVPTMKSPSARPAKASAVLGWCLHSNSGACQALIKRERFVSAKAGHSV